MTTERLSIERIQRWRSPRQRLRTRRSWFIQRLEPRCVMAGDLSLDTHPILASTEAYVASALGSLSTDLATRTILTSTPSDSSQLDTANNDAPEVFASHDETVDEAVEADFQPELFVPLDLLDAQPMELQAKQGQAVVFSFAPTGLNEFVGSYNSLQVQLVYDPTRWQLPSDRIAQRSTEEPRSADGEIAETLLGPQVNLQLQLVSLADQTVYLRATALPASEVDGGPSQIILELVDDPSTPAKTEWLTESLEWDAGIIASDSDRQIGPGLWDKCDIGFSSPISTEMGNHEGDTPESTMVGEESDGTKPTEHGESEPLPEARRETGERISRNARRTLDIRSPGSTTWSAPVANRSTTATTNSLATQQAIARAYDEDVSFGVDRSRQVLDSQPARLQAATFLLRRADGFVSSMAMNTTKPQVRVGSNPTEYSVVMNSEPVARPAVSESHLETRVTAVAPSSVVNLSERESASAVSEATAHVIRPKSDAQAEEDAEVGTEHSLYAGIVDRLLGSPLGLAGILGLTVIVRVNESSEPVASARAKF